MKIANNSELRTVLKRAHALRERGLRSKTSSIYPNHPRRHNTWLWKSLAAVNEGRVVAWNRLGGFHFLQLCMSRGLLRCLLSASPLQAYPFGRHIRPPSFGRIKQAGRYRAFTSWLACWAH